MSKAQVEPHLYIPHGSDESLLGVVCALAFITFISHMVQMKEVRQVTLFRPNRPLYPTWFR